MDTTRVALGAAVAFDYLLWFIVVYFRRASAWHYPAGTFIPVDKGRVEAHYHSIRIRNSARPADEMFHKMSRFTELNTHPTRALQNATAVGDVITFDMVRFFPEDFGQADFDVKVTKLDPQ
ncbi:MAG TPA: hypothetical protein VML55_13995, partial [Planctomycetaceae bacterium]|nr:hypothetical protein [Planctomycetaceae bacterium]